MSLIRQIWLLLALVVGLSFAGGLGLSVVTARDYLADQISFKDNDAAQSIALALGQQKGDRAGLEAVLASQFDTGHYASMRLVGPDGVPLVQRSAGEPLPSRAPGWFVSLVGIHPEPGVAQVSAGWAPVGRLEVRSALSFAHDELWSHAVSAALFHLLLAGVAAAVGALVVRRLQGPLQQTVLQAQAITERRFNTVPEPSIPELRNVTRAMNTMVTRLKSLFDEQASQVEQYRRQAHCDPLTGLAHRQHFMARLRVALDSEDGSASGALILVRLVDLQALNRRVGRAAADRLIHQASQALAESGRRHGAIEVGRLNGSDFALLLQDVASLREPAVDAAAQLRGLFVGHENISYAVASAVRWWHGAPMSSLLAAADQALARAEAAGPYWVEIDDTGDGLALGEDTWRQRIEDALAHRRAQLVAFPLMDRHDQVLHLECPLRLQLEANGPLLPAVQWLPMARRAGLTARVDALAAELALKAIAADGLPRSVNVSPASLLDSNFLPRLRALLAEQRDAAPGLSLEVAETGALRQLHLMRALAEMCHGFGSHVGLEHAGEGLGDAAGGLLEAGLDFAKIDASLTQGSAADNARLMHVGGLVRMLHGIGLKVYAEGVQDHEDAAALLGHGMDGVTGPAVRQAAG